MSADKITVLRDEEGYLINPYECPNRKQDFTNSLVTLVMCPYLI